MKLRSSLTVLLVVAFILGAAFAAAPQRVYRAASDFWGPKYQAQAAAVPNKAPLPPGKDKDPALRIRHWNELALNATGLDHTPVAPGENRVFGEEIGPVRSARAMAVIHIAMFEAVNAIDGRCKSYMGIAQADKDTSMNCAIAQAAHDTLCAMYPSQKPIFDQELAD